MKFSTTSPQVIGLIDNPHKISEIQANPTQPAPLKKIIIEVENQEEPEDILP